MRPPFVFPGRRPSLCGVVLYQACVHGSTPRLKCELTGDAFHSRGQKSPANYGFDAGRSPVLKEPQRVVRDEWRAVLELQFFMIEFENHGIYSK